jgi:hypothetical protein
MFKISFFGNAKMATYAKKRRSIVYCLSYITCFSNVQKYNTVHWITKNNEEHFCCRDYIFQEQNNKQAHKMQQIL